ncbi:MAG: GNAT family N-acetyltransferase [Gammaproteobacteria bacterium]|nr:GNAT family N-acetyltransferase [Gammaproteobacteria bacterium]
MTAHDDIAFRPMVAEDMDRYPIGCQGSPEDVAARIRDLGASAILAFDGARHVGQLQFRRYDPGLRSPKGVYEPAYWGDFGERAPDLGDNALAVFCYHVGQTDDSEQRDPAYFGRGIGLALLDSLLDWAGERGFDAVVAKATPAARPVMTMMGGQPVDAYRERGFEIAATWVDEQVREMVLERGLATPAADAADAWQVSCCVKAL